MNNLNHQTFKRLSLFQLQCVQTCKGTPNCGCFLIFTHNFNLWFCIAKMPWGRYYGGAYFRRGMI